ARRASPKPEAILKWAMTPIAIMVGLWAAARATLATGDDRRPPVFILVAKNKRIAKTLHEWIADEIRPPGIGSLKIPELRNRPGETNTVRVDTGVVFETDSGHPKSDENAWMRLTLDTVGREQWPEDRQGRPIHPEGFAQLAAKLGRPLSPPGRDVRCIVSVGMLTEGWDCNTVSHVVGLRPFQSQLLCEQVVGRALCRRSYDVGADGRLEEEVAEDLRCGVRDRALQGERPGARGKAVAAANFRRAAEGRLRHHRPACPRLRDRGEEPHHGP
ncbi:MAG: hypothetical protein ACREFV_08450, partial [Acetobacteraceae bacterium]